VTGFEARPGERPSGLPGGTVLLGQRVWLTVEGATSIRWQLPMAAICAGYEVSADRGRYIPPGQGLETALKPEFNFLRGGDFRIPFQAHTGHGELQGSFAITVQVPVGNAEHRLPGAAGYYPDGPGARDGVVALAQANTQLFGIEFGAEVTNPSSQHGLRAGFIQVCRAARSLQIDTGGFQPCPANGKSLCDNHGESPLYNGTLVDVPPGQRREVRIGDRPSVSTRPGLGEVEEVWIEDERFETFLVVIAATPGSIYVPLGCFDWSWRIHARRDGDRWRTDGAGQRVQTRQTGSPPAWTGRIGVRSNSEWGDWGAARTTRPGPETLD
jgi:hypothetical protein